MKLGLQTAASVVCGLLIFGLVLFYPAGTFHYWQGWVFLAIFIVASIVPSLYLARTNPAALQRRMRAGPVAETRILQKFIIVGAMAGFFAMIALSALDYRFGWSSVPAAVTVVGDVLVAVGLGIAMLTIVQNGYAASTVTVEDGQHVVSTGFYSRVRHPMYVGNLILMAGIPLALGSYWGLVIYVPALLVLVARIVDEERALVDGLDGYRDYMQRVRYRLIPHVW
ncbi:hypothetical protein A5634_14920 [Mycobacterium asiaticum]|uniref:Steroid 5-alpha reductase C-terminal domain-containing protein n=1 Tax=Mycobacterium asiaticum TaxID=1790 RepID=A0A1A3PCD8_MYCAS|nr:isoprenylcysteine carboxylmethyltransferase family protein [Mycobacterium asiaticum]OBK30959.1 hypothetical protein A5634_14920 [Mycobacterium asiaticum]